MNKTRIICFCLFYFLQNSLMAQNVGIGTTAPHQSAMLDVTSGNKGLLTPQVSLTTTQQATPVIGPAEGLLLFNTNAAITGIGSAGIGFYYWRGNRWIKLANAPETWSLTGNIFTDTAVNFIGTIDNKALMFRVGNQAAGRLEINGENLFFGYEAGRFNVHNPGDFKGERNTFIGSGAGKTNIDGRSHTYIGAASGRSLSGGFGNTMVGAYTGASNIIGQFNTNVGYVAGGGIGDGSKNTAIGYQAGSFMGTDAGSQGNVTVGYEAGVSLRNGAGNVVIGRHAGNGDFSQNGIGSYNVYIGDSSAPNSNNAQRNVAIGWRSGRNIFGGSRNVLIGDSAGHLLTSGSGNTFIGSLARTNSPTIQNATAIGSNAFVIASNALVLGSIAGVNGAEFGVNVGIGITNPLSILHIVDGIATGVTANSNSRLVLDKSGSNHYLSILSDNNREGGILFGVAGAPSVASSNGGIVYNSPSNILGLQFRTGGNATRMSISGTGNVGIGVLSPTEKLDILGNIKVDGEINRPATGAAHLLPICYGSINSAGTIQEGTGNFTVTKAGVGIYDITISGEFFSTPAYIVHITPVATLARMAVVSSSSGAARFRVFDAGGGLIDNQFLFTIYKP